MVAALGAGEGEQPLYLFGVFIAGTMALVLYWYNYNRRAHAQQVERLLAFARAESGHH